MKGWEGLVWYRGGTGRALGRHWGGDRRVLEGYWVAVGGAGRDWGAVGGAGRALGCHWGGAGVLGGTGMALGGCWMALGWHWGVPAVPLTSVPMS